MTIKVMNHRLALTKFSLYLSLIFKKDLNEDCALPKRGKRFLFGGQGTLFLCFSFRQGITYLSNLCQKVSDVHQKASDVHQKVLDVHQKTLDGKRKAI